MFCFFFFNDTATTEIYTLSLHDALPICRHSHSCTSAQLPPALNDASETPQRPKNGPQTSPDILRSEEHTSELQSPCNLVCRLLLEKKKKKTTRATTRTTERTTRQY